MKLMKMYQIKIYLVKIPDDVKVYVENIKAKASAIIIVKEVGIEEIYGYGSFWEKFWGKIKLKKA